MAVYSTQFALGQLAGVGPTVIYTVPAGHIAVLRGIDTCITGVGPSPTSFAINAFGPSIFPGGDASTVADGGTHWTGYQVLNAADTVSMNANTAGTNYILSGYLLAI